MSDGGDALVQAERALADALLDAAMLWRAGQPAGGPAWGLAAVEGFVKDPPRAVRLAELACRKPEVKVCTDLARAMAADADPVLAEGGRRLLGDACRAGVGRACQADGPEAPR